MNRKRFFSVGFLGCSFLGLFLCLFGLAGMSLFIESSFAMESDDAPYFLMSEKWKTLRKSKELHIPKDEKGGLGKNAPSYWTPQYTPAFPADWPIKPNTDFVYYTYMIRKDFENLKDAHYVGEIWGKIISDGKLILNETVDDNFENISLEILNSSPKNIGKQGIKPDPYKSIFMRANQLQELLNSENQAQIKKYFCGWAKRNGVIWKQIKPHQEKFIDSLACKL